MNLDLVMREHFIICSLPFDFIFLNTPCDPLADFATAIKLVVKISKIHALVCLDNMFFEVFRYFMRNIGANVFVLEEVLDDLAVAGVWAQAVRLEAR